MEGPGLDPVMWVRLPRALFPSRPTMDGLYSRDVRSPSLISEVSTRGKYLMISGKRGIPKMNRPGARPGFVVWHGR